MKQKLYYLVTATVLAGSGMLSSCREDTPEISYGESNTPIGIYTRAEGEGADLPTGDRTARLLFWTEDVFHNKWMEGEAALPNKTAVLPEDINNYNYGSRIFTTGIQYLTDDAPYHVTGYAPDYALTPSKTDSEDFNYSVLVVEEEYQNGKIDFLSCDGNSEHLGSTNSPFTLEEHELKFRHLTACISFKARRGDKMLNKIAVKNVNIRVKKDNGLHIPIAFERCVQKGQGAEGYDTKDQSTYRIQKTVSQTGDIKILSPDENYIRYNEEKEIGACYVVAGMGNELFDYNPFEELEEKDGQKELSISVTADYWLMTTGEDDNLNYQFLRTASWDNDVKVNITTNTGSMFYPGYRYEVLITFNSDEILLEGKNVGWEDGGEHYLPVYPNATEEPAN